MIKKSQRNKENSNIIVLTEYNLNIWKAKTEIVFGTHTKTIEL